MSKTFQYVGLHPYMTCLSILNRSAMKNILLLMVCLLLMTACSTKPNSRYGADYPKKSEIVHLRFTEPVINVWSRLTIKQTSGIMTEKDGVLSMNGSGWVEYATGNKVESRNGKLYFDDELIEISSPNMIVGKDYYVMGAFLRKFE